MILKRYQNDFVSPYAREITPYILDAFKNAKVNDANLKTSLRIIRELGF